MARTPGCKKKKRTGVRFRRFDSEFCSEFKIEYGLEMVLKVKNRPKICKEVIGMVELVLRTCAMKFESFCKLCNHQLVGGC